ncbi:hypothetical protein Y032_0007g3195 [Ancylostoma ceylanicum]|uniref:Uncharacterized protein n=1 Tax=Ancylostoma ceylanicum TaxID=53326 RepID=A0A016VMX4_9BILA|nr:hypothetical protein Y032_0007g3195 [Ancylostoma ceylanicum]
MFPKLLATSAFRSCRLNWYRLQCWSCTSVRGFTKPSQTRRTSEHAHLQHIQHSFVRPLHLPYRISTEKRWLHDGPVQPSFVESDVFLH